MKEPKVKVLYIGGYSRSGSTVLLRLLGLLDGLLSVGELWDIWQRSLLENQLCGCGQPFRLCEFWTAVVREAYGGFQELDAEEMQRLRQSVYSSRTLLPLLFPTLRGPRYRRQLALYQKALADLYLATQKVSGSKFVVDSSKVPTYALLLNENAAIDLHVLHLIRDSRATTHSWQRKKQRPEIYWKKAYMARYSASRAAMEWNVMNGLFRKLEGAASAYLALRYEDMTRQPYKSLVTIARWLGLPDPDPALFTAERSVEFGVDHTVSGNPNRFQKGAVEIRPDLAWHAEMPARRKALVTTMTWPLLRHYGYPLRAGGADSANSDMNGRKRFASARHRATSLSSQSEQEDLIVGGNSTRNVSGNGSNTIPAIDEIHRNRGVRQKLKILMVTPRYLPYVGGTEIHTYEVARRLAESGHEVSVLTTDHQRVLAPQEVADGIRLYRVPAWPRGRDYHFAPGIYRVIRNGDWDLIHVQGFHTFVAPLAMLAARRARIPYLVTFHSGGHSSRLRNAIRPLQRTLLRPLLAQARKLIGVSSWEVEFFRDELRLPADRFLFIPNGSYLPAPTSQAQKPKDRVLIVSVGRLERYKGHHRVITAMPEIIKQRPEVHLRIIGTGPYEDALRRLALEHGVADRVEIRAVAGSQRQEMASVLMGAELVILLSDYESQGIAVMEALALGRPVLVASSTALRELAEQGLARATPLGSDAREVADAILHQLNSPLIPHDVDLPTWDGCYDSLAALYERVVAESA